MRMHADCPDSETLQAYANNRAGPNESTIIDRHLRECPACRDQFVQIPSRGTAPEIPNCRVIKEIGRGRFGVVYKAWTSGEQPKLVALKILNQAGPMERSRFDREIAVLKRLDSPGIVKCIESGETGDMMYYTMEYVEGMHLDEFLENSALDLAGKLRVFQRVCEAVADAHARGVVHRDLKPRNILIDVSGRPHILDFGVCTLESDDWSSSARGTLTHAGDVIGTLKYMSPEQAWGGAAGAIDERSDVWALGVMLYGIVTDGGYPYSLRATPDKPVHEALLDRIRKELPEIPRLDRLPRGRELETLLERCLAWEPDKRLASAAVLASDLQRYVAGRRIKTKPLWVPYRIQRVLVGAAIRSRWLFSTSFVAGLAVVVWACSLVFDVGWRTTAPGLAPYRSVAAAGAPSTTARDAVLVAGLSDDSVDAVISFANRHGVPGVNGLAPTWRPVHGILMKRLVAARPRAVVWDYYFESEAAGDAMLSKGIAALERAGIPVVVAALNYSERGEPALSAGVSDVLETPIRHGAIFAREMVERPGEFITVIRTRVGAFVPSLALTTVASVVHPDSRLELAWKERGSPIELLYGIGERAYRRERDRVTPTKVFESPVTMEGVKEGDLVACFTVDLAEPDEWRRRTVPYETLLTCSDDELRRLVEGRVLLVGDLRRPRFGFEADRHRVRFGRKVVENVPGCYLQADAIVGLLGQGYMELALPFSPLEFAAILCAAAVGCLVPMRLARWTVLRRARYRRVLWVVLFAGATASLVIMVSVRETLAVHAAMIGLSVFLPMAGSFWVEFTRNRHRISGAQRPIGVWCGPGSGPTITLPPRGTSLPEAK